jgi:hypothetical protein
VHVKLIPVDALRIEKCLRAVMSSKCRRAVVVRHTLSYLAIIVRNSRQLPWEAKKYIMPKTLTSGSSENSLRQGGAAAPYDPCV